MTKADRTLHVHRRRHRFLYRRHRRRHPRHRRPTRRRHSRPRETGQRSLAENTATGTRIGSPVSASDPQGDALTYSLGGRDADLFDIVPTSGQLVTKEPLDYETRSRYSVVVTVHDGKDFSGNADTVIDATTERHHQPHQRQRGRRGLVLFRPSPHWDAAECRRLGPGRRCVRANVEMGALRGRRAPGVSSKPRPRPRTRRCKTTEAGTYGQRRPTPTGTARARAPMPCRPPPWW